MFPVVKHLFLPSLSFEAYCLMNVEHGRETTAVFVLIASLNVLCGRSVQSELRPDMRKKF